MINMLKFIINTLNSPVFCVYVTDYSNNAIAAPVSPFVNSLSDAMPGFDPLASVQLNNSVSMIDNCSFGINNATQFCDFDTAIPFDSSAFDTGFSNFD
ncbi:hypothetical protein RGU72_10835 [Undibacterium sp. 5I1]|uniref:hypothetical protein n=1 Tax=unclassified Undibacterium TaxID=2630295 RepID=UPI002AB48295|nr:MULTISPECIES: hypothetical protein [unclassified Undibacterium]MDY7538752.1 hypothetical protein [Undibacterium sp. 5I1]MEB0229691.1 hypothetical protein [Undibacterium sp. 10I3]MEB0258444.1 hypothetical protein [Undibacterium sp. 5I1]